MSVILYALHLTRGSIPLIMQPKRTEPMQLQWGTDCGLTHHDDDADCEVTTVIACLPLPASPSSLPPSFVLTLANLICRLPPPPPIRLLFIYSRRPSLFLLLPPSFLTSPSPAPSMCDKAIYSPSLYHPDRDGRQQERRLSRGQVILGTSVRS